MSIRKIHIIIPEFKKNLPRNQLFENAIYVFETFPKLKAERSLIDNQFLSL